MHPPFSMIFFTTLAGAAQGLLLALVGMEVLGASVPRLMYVSGAMIVLVMGAVSLVAAAFHLGHPLRAWRAVMMWRTSWLSREVIVMPAFMGLVALWGLGHATGALSPLLPGLLAAVLAVVLYVCTGMIYAAIKAIRQWAHPITPVNYALIGMASGLLLATALAAAFNVAAVSTLAALALATTLAAAASRGWALRRNLSLVPKTTLQSAIGVRHPRIEQKAQGAMGGSFNTREFFHGRGDGFVTRVRWAAAVLGFGLPVVALALGMRSAEGLGLLFALQYLGLLAERWSFFAEGQHTQNPYYRSVS